MLEKTINRLAVMCCAVLLTAACSDAVSPPNDATRGLAPLPGASLAASSRDIVPDGKGVDLIDDPNPPARTRYRIEYHNLYHTSRVMTGIVDVYFIWYGDWTGKDADQQILTDLASTIGNTPYFNTVRLYPDSNGTPGGSAIVYGGAGVDASSHGTVLSDTDLGEIVDRQIDNFLLPYDPQGIYVIFGAPNVTASSGQDASYCAMHGTTARSKYFQTFIYVGAPSRSPSHCAAQVIGPNGTLDGDGAAYLLVAELANTVTDPWLNAWYDRLGLEVADKCLWTYGAFYKAANGAAANVRLGQRDFLLPQLWAPSKNGGACALHW
jgi:hypothetical protein